MTSDNERLIKIKESEVQNKHDGLPTPLKDKIGEYIPPTEYIISYGESKAPLKWREDK